MRLLLRMAKRSASRIYGPLIAIGIIALVASGGIVAAAASAGVGVEVFTPVRMNSGYGMSLLRFHRCGNGIVEYRESCDDGNRRSGDGCSRWCRKETAVRRCADGHAYGERFRAPDGCNTCICSASGIACTEMACTPRSSSSTSAGVAAKCLSSNQCPAGQYCTTEDGACESACEPGAMVCIQACAGRCRKEGCRPMICPDGSAHPTCTEDGHVINYFADPCLTHQASSRPLSCDRERAQFTAAVEANDQCSTNADCLLFQASCPYVTCGAAINKNGERSVRAAADAYTTCQERSGGPVACAGCVQQTVACVNNRCVTR